MKFPGSPLVHLLDKINKVAGSRNLTLGLSFYALGLVLVGILYQQIHGVQQGVELLFQSWIIWQWTIPLLGGRLVLLLFTLHGLWVGLDRLIRRQLSLALGLIVLGWMVFVLGITLNLELTQESVLALEVGSSDDKAFEVNQWDLVVYQIFDGTEVVRTPLERSTTQLIIPDQSNPLSLSFRVTNLYRNAQRIDPQTIQPRPMDLEAVRNTPGVILENLLLKSDIGDGNQSQNQSQNQNQNQNDELHGQLIAEDPLVLHSLDTRPRDLVFSPTLGALGLLLEPREVRLPFTLTIESVENLRIPGTQNLARQITQIRLDPPGVQGVIQEDSPFRFGNYLLDQRPLRVTAPDQGIFQPITVIRMRKSHFAWLAFLGVGLMILGLLMELGQTLGFWGKLSWEKFRKLPRTMKGIIALILMLGLNGGGPGTVSAQGLDHQQPSGPEGQVEFSFSRQVVDSIGGFIVQHRGRFMPLERFGSEIVTSLGITQRVEGLLPEEVFTLILLAPGQADTLALFPVEDPEVFEVLELPYDQPGNYSYNQLAQGFFILAAMAEVLDQVLLDPNRPFDPLEQEILQLYQRGVTYFQYRGALNPSSLGALGQDPLGWQDHPLRLIPLLNRLEPTIIPEAFHPLDADLVQATPMGQALGDPELVSELARVMIQGVDPQDPGLWLEYTDGLRDFQQSYFRSAFDSSEVRALITRIAAERWIMRFKPWVGIELLLVIGIFLWIFTGLFHNQKDELTQGILRVGWFGVVLQRVLAVGAALGAMTTLALTLGILGWSALTTINVQLLWVSTSLISFWALLSLKKNKTHGTLSILYLVCGLGAWIVLMAGVWVGSLVNPFDQWATFRETRILGLLNQIFKLFGFSGMILGGITAGLLLCLPGTHGLTNRSMGTQEELMTLMNKTIHLGWILLTLGTLLGSIDTYGTQARFWNWTPEENSSLLLILWTSLTLQLGTRDLQGPRLSQVFGTLGFLGIGVYWFGIHGQDLELLLYSTLGLGSTILLLGGIFALLRFREGRKNL